MAIEKNITADDIARELRALLKSLTKPKAKFIGPGGALGEGGDDDDGGMPNIMTAVGDLIRGGTAGAPARLAIGSTSQVLTVVGGIPTWVTPDASIIEAKYRQYVVSPNGSDGFDLIDDGTGSPVYSLEDLE